MRCHLARTLGRTDRCSDLKPSASLSLRFPAAQRRACISLVHSRLTLIFTILGIQRQLTAAATPAGIAVRCRAPDQTKSDPPSTFTVAPVTYPLRREAR